MYLFRWFDGNYQIDGVAQKTPHVASTLNFIRNGPTGYDVDDAVKAQVPVKGGANNETACAEYRNAIAASYNFIDKHPELFYDDWRVGIDVPPI